MGESENRGNKKIKLAKYSENQTFLTSDSHTYVCESGGKKCSFFGKLGVLCFVFTSDLRFTLYLIFSSTNFCVILAFF